MPFMLSEEMNIIRTDSDVFSKIFVADHAFNLVSTIKSNISASSSIWLIRQCSSLSVMMSSSKIDVWEGSCLSMMLMVMLFGIMNGISSYSSILPKVFISNHSGNRISSVSSDITTSICVWLIRESLQESMILADFLINLSQSLLHSIKLHSFLWAFQLFLLSD